MREKIKRDSMNTYSRHLATIRGHKIYLADYPAENDDCELTLFNSCRYLFYRKSILSCFKHFYSYAKNRIPRDARFFIYCRSYDHYEIWSRDYK